LYRNCLKKILQNKKSALLKQNLREIAVMLAEDPPKEEKAYIRAEALVRDDNYIEAFEILQLNCELLHERVKLVEFTKKDQCPPELMSLVGTIIWSSYRVEVKELESVRKQLVAKFGKAFETSILANPLAKNQDDTAKYVNEKVVTKLSFQPPAAFLVQVYLEKICEMYEVDWKPSAEFLMSQDGSNGQPIQPPSGYSVPMAGGTGLGNGIAIDNSGDLGHKSRGLGVGGFFGSSSTTNNNGSDINNNNNTNSGNNNNSNNNGSNGGGGLGTIMSYFKSSPKTTDNVYEGKNGRYGGIKASTGTSTKNFGAALGNYPPAMEPPTATIPSQQQDRHQAYNGHDSDYQEIDVKYNIADDNKNNNNGIPPSAPPGSVRGFNEFQNQIEPKKYNPIVQRTTLDPVVDDSRQDDDNNDDDDNDPAPLQRSMYQSPYNSATTIPHSNVQTGASNGSGKYKSERDLFMESSEYSDLVARFGQLTR
jgi:Regulator of Vps4 activity in the MVB pathway